MDATLDAQEKTKRKHNLLLLHNLNMAGSNGTSSTNNNGNSFGPLSPSHVGNGLGIGSSSLPTSSTMSPNARCFYPPCDTVESVIGEWVFLSLV